MRRTILFIAITLLTLAIPATSRRMARPARDRAETGPAWKQTSPSRWSEKENIVWKVPIPGKGHSSPIGWGERIFVTTCLEEKQKRMLLCLDRHTGKTLWEREFLRGRVREETQAEQLHQFDPGNRRRACLGDLPRLSEHPGRLLRLRWQADLAEIAGQVLSRPWFLQLARAAHTDYAKTGLILGCSELTC